MTGPPFTAPGLLDPTDAHYLPDDEDSNRERAELFRRWETEGLTSVEDKDRLAALTRDRLTDSPGDRRL